MSEDLTRIVDDGSLRKYRTEIPNTVIRGIRGQGLSVHALWLYVYLKSITGDSGSCWQNIRTIAMGSKMSPGAVSKAKHELLDAKLIKIEPGDKARHQSDVIKITDIWLDNMLEFSSSPYELAKTSEEIEGMPLFNDRVHHMNAPSSPGERDRVHEMNKPRSRGDTQEDPKRRRSQERRNKNSIFPSSENQKIETPQQLFDLYNTFADQYGFQKLIKPTDARRKKASKYIRQFPERDFWEMVFKEYPQSTFLRGLKESPGHPPLIFSLDWLTQAGKSDGVENCVKVYEGKYRDKEHKESAPCTHPYVADIAEDAVQCPRCMCEMRKSEWQEMRKRATA